jgi:predicted PurR-regulated permease PerM
MSETYRPYYERHAPPETDSPGDSEEASNGALVSLGYLTALFLPIVGFVLGVVIVTRPSRRTSKHGVPVIVVSLVAFIVAFALFASLIATGTSSASHTFSTQARAIQEHMIDEEAALKRRQATEEAETRTTERRDLESKMAAEKVIFRREPEGSYASDLARDEYEAARGQLQQLEVR